MTTRSRGPLAGFRWLAQGTSVIFRHPRPLLGGAGFLVVACLLPSLVTLPLQLRSLHTGVPQSPAMFAVAMAFSMLIGLLILPLYAGYLRLIDAAEHGHPARAVDIFKPYGDGSAWRLLGYGLAIAGIYIAVLGAIIAASGGAIVRWYMEVMTAQALHQPAPTTLPGGFGIAIAAFMLLSLLLMGFYAISLGQVALRSRPVFGALADGVVGALKNVLPLLMFALGALLAWIAVAIVFVVVVLVLALLAKFIGPWLVLVVVIPMYIAMLLAMLSVMFGVMYRLWRDVCGDELPTGTPPPFPA